MTYGDGVFKVFVNGEPEGSVNLTDTLYGTSGVVRIGGGGMGYFDGTIDEVEIFNRALDATEIQAIYDAGAAGKCKCLAPAGGLVSWWTGGGTAQDIRGKNHGVLRGGAYYSAGYVDDVPAFGFDGSDDFVEAANSPSLNPAQALTLNAWVWAEALPANYTDILSKDPEDTEAPREYILNLAKTGSQVHFRAHVTTNGILTYVDGATPVAEHTWYHVAMTYDGTALKLYVNGSQDASIPATGTISANTQPFRIGGGAPPDHAQYFFNGLVDEVQLHNRALPASVIQEIYNKGVFGQCKTRWIFLPLACR